LIYIRFLELIDVRKEELAYFFPDPDHTGLVCDAVLFPRQADFTHLIFLKIINQSWFIVAISKYSYAQYYFKI